MLDDVHSCICQRSYRQKLRDLQKHADANTCVLAIWRVNAKLLLPRSWP